MEGKKRTVPENRRSYIRSSSRTFFQFEEKGGTYKSSEVVNQKSSGRKKEMERLRFRKPSHQGGELGRWKKTLER